MKKQFTLLCIFILISIYTCLGQSGNDWFSFDIPPLDTAMREFYPVFDQPPIGNNDFVTINTVGNFEVNGEKICFWGTPCSRDVSGSLPKSMYPAMVKELKKNGVNIVRFHLWDSEDFNTGTSYFGGGPGTRDLAPETLDRLDYLIYLLKQNGIYAYIDLLCDRKYTAEDGVYSPDSTYKAAKIVNFFDPQLIKLQKEFANKLLTHVNPYTENALVDEPTMAIIDIVNEGWLFHALRSREIRLTKDGGKLSHYHYHMLTSQWNDFLFDKYGTTEAIDEALGTSANNMISAGGFEVLWENWTYWNYWKPSDFTMEYTSNDSYSGNNSFHVYSPASSANKYDCQLMYAESFFQPNSTYELKFRAKSDNSSKIEYVIQIDKSPWTSYASGEFALTGEWAEYSTTITINELTTDPYLYFNLGKVNGNVWIDEVSVKNTSADEEEKYDWYYIEDIMGENQRKTDQAEFLIKLQEDYYAEIYNYLKDSLGVQVPVTGSNYITGPTDIAIQSSTDFIDNHGYWASWSAPDPVSMIPHTDYYNPVLGMFSGSGVSGKPYTISEYNYQFVNYYAYESLFFLTAYGAFHEADMLMVHGLEYDPFWDFMYEGFAGYAQISYKAMQPTMAYVYRNKMITPARQTIDVNFSDSDLKDYVYKNNPWSTDLYPDDYPFKLAYQHKVKVKFDNNSDGYKRSNYPQETVNPYQTDTDEIEWDNTGLFSVKTPQFCAFVGSPGQFKEKNIGAVTIVEGDKSAGFTLLALDNKPIEKSEKMIMTVTTQMKNTGMTIDGFNVINYGVKPRIVEAASLKIRIKTEMEKMVVNWLDESGQKSDYYKIFENNGNGEIPVTINTYENPGVWFGIKKYTSYPPVADAGSDQNVNEGETVTLDGSNSYDANDDPLTFHWTAPEGITLSSETTAQPIFTAPEVTEDIGFTFTLTVNDGTDDSEPDEVTITVQQVNNTPVADAVTDQSVAEGETVTLDGSNSSDPDGDPLTYLWTSPEGITLSSETAAQPTFTAPEVTEDTEYTFTLIVNDGTEDSEPDEVIVSVLNQTNVSTLKTDNPGFKIYPNPTTGKVTISFNGMLKAEINIYNLYGQLVFKEKIISPKEQHFDLSNQANGLYFIHLKSNNGNQIKKLTIYRHK